MEKYLRFLQIILALVAIMIVVVVVIWFNQPEKLAAPNYRIHLCLVQEDSVYSLKNDYIKLTFINTARGSYGNRLWLRKNGKLIKTYKYDGGENHPIKYDGMARSQVVEEYSKTLGGISFYNYLIYTDIFKGPGEYELKLRAQERPSGLGRLRIGESDWIKIKLVP